MNIAPWIYAPSSYTALSSPTIDKINMLGVALYIFGQVSNFITHLNLASLRSTGGTERKIPVGYGFNIVTCPNYMFELISWVGMLLVTKSLSTLLFFGLALWKMNQWGWKREKAYRKEFPETYKKKKYAVVPGLRF